MTAAELRSISADDHLRWINQAVTRPWVLMEICGGQTHSILRSGLDQVLPPELELVHGPGCPVCVTPVSTIDAAVNIASLPNVTLCTFGDMLRVPGHDDDLSGARSKGADVRVVYSPLDAVNIAAMEPEREVVFLAIGFETTAPTTAMAASRAAELSLGNFSMIVSHVLVPPAVDAIAGADDSRVQAVLAAGHVCTVMGTSEYEPLVERHRVPIVVTGFEPLDLLAGIRGAVRQLEAGEARLENAYGRVVRPEGNPAARAMLRRVFEVCDRDWRGIGVIPDSGWRLRDEFARFDAAERFDVDVASVRDDDRCRAGEVLQGLLRPPDCPEFGSACTPDHPLGAPMVSAEGACAAYHRHRKLGAS